MKKLVLIVHLHTEKEKKKAMSKVSGLSGVVSVAIDMKEKKMTVTGEVDVVDVASKLKKLCCAEIVTVSEGEEEKKKADEVKKEGGESDGNKTTFDHISELEKAYRFYNPHMYYHPVVCSDDNPNSCVIS